MNMKSIRKAKPGDSIIPGKAASIASLAQDEVVIEKNDQDWLPPKQLLKPPGQVVLTDKELEEEFTRILNANNPHAPQNISRYSHKESTFKTVANMEHCSFHFEFDGYLVYTGNDDEIAPASEKTESETKVEGDEGITVDAAEGVNTSTEDTIQKQPSRNQFNYSERAAQSVNNPSRSKSTNTDPPPHRSFAGNVSQWSIYDDYMEDLQTREKLVKDKEKTKSSNLKKEDDKPLLVQDSHEDVYYKNQELRKVMVIAERMANQNSFDEVCQDYKYYNDAADELGDKKSGSLLPLWTFSFQKQKSKQVTSISWSPLFPDLFVVGFGSYEFAKQTLGLIACFTLKNPSYPEFLYETTSGVMSAVFHPDHPSMIAAGLYDGSVVVYNIQKKTDQPVFRSKSGHGDPVWQVSWQKDDLDENMNFCSVSTDGKVIQWTLLKTELVSTEVIKFKHDKDDDGLFTTLGGTCFDFHKSTPNLFIVGSEEGKLFKCSKEYSSQPLMTFTGHKMAVYGLRHNPFNPNFFITASADWTVKIWDYSDPQPIITFDLSASVGDVAWAPFSSTVFAAVTSEGKIFVFDLNVNKYSPMCEQQAVKKSKLTHISFNPFEPVLLVGDEKGQVISMKLSPNLRKVAGGREEEIEKLQNVINAARGVSNY